MYVPIADYRPDVSEMNSFFTDTMVNVFPADGSYIPVPDVDYISKPLQDRVLGAYCIRSGTAVKIFVGGLKKLYMFDQTSRGWKDITKDGTEYQADIDNPWSFTVFGHYLIAVNQKDTPQCFNLKTGDRFEDLGGNPPKARFVKVWGDFLCLLNLENHPNRVQWSGLNDINHWTVGQKNCDYQDFPDGEFVQGSTEATNPIIFMRSAIYAGMFTAGSRVIFSFNKIQDKRGAKSSASIACRGAHAFFIDDGGFYQIGFNGQILPIGFEKVDRTLMTKFDNDAIGEITGTVDPVHNRVYWSVNTSVLTQTTLVYDWVLEKWSTLQTERMFLFPAYTVGYNLDQLDEVAESVEDIPVSLDSRLWQSGAPVLACVNTEGRLGMFTGRPREAILMSQEVGQVDGQVSFLEKVFVEIDTWDAVLSIGKRMLRSEGEPVVWSDERRCSDVTGAFHCRSRGRYHRFKIRVPSGILWRHIRGFNSDVRASGHR